MSTRSLETQIVCLAELIEEMHADHDAMLEESLALEADAAMLEEEIREKEAVLARLEAEYMEIQGCLPDRG